ncbi:MAG: hypothetical protein HON98_10130 [Chloroflexi bacterium]|jgi:hypothetical protein|nr:hypothetical protein [Chloroflexota bacterium]MBT3670901.1 hypothetical protein [Chloroflexota bacterium]MBT4002910.1 hypothetical protein [Chloroflexota bacterium]MBT4306385.1 hypothetical protein [Chloroflexota bacterium]MBT4532734.1 hypothetical protein [Chloroflexota bacterium]
MKKRYLLFLVALIIFSACSPVETENTPTLPPLYNEKPLVTPTLLSLYTTRPTNTPKVFPTSTPLIIPPTSEPVPRWTILSQPGYGVELLGETWDYVTDRWGDSFACIKYENEEGIYTWFEQCFAFITPDTTFEGILAPFIENGYQEIIPQNDYSQTGKHILVGKAEDYGYHYLELLSTNDYLYLVEIGSEFDNSGSVQDFYLNNLYPINNLVIENMLHKSNIKNIEPTPISPSQMALQANLEKYLLHDYELGMGWVQISDYIPEGENYICRNFELRVNEDVTWVESMNCIYEKSDNFEFSSLDQYILDGDEILESSNVYDGDVLIYGYSTGHLFYNAWYYKGDLIYRVILETRARVGATVEGSFSENVDDFLYRVLMVNVEKGNK